MACSVFVAAGRPVGLRCHDRRYVLINERVGFADNDVEKDCQLTHGWRMLVHPLTLRGPCRARNARARAVQHDDRSATSAILLPHRRGEQPAHHVRTTWPALVDPSLM